MRTRKRHMFFRKKDKRTAILTWQESADGGLLVVYISSNILDFLLIKNLARSTNTHRDFVASSAASRPEKLVPLAFKTAFLLWNSCQMSICGKSKFSNICSRCSLNSSKDMNKNVISTWWSIAKISQTSRGTQREYSSKPLKHSISERILVFKR